MNLFDRQRRKRQQENLDNNYYQRAKAYQEAKTTEQIRIAAEKGKLAAQKEANQKPFYQKLIGAGTAIVKDLQTGNPNQLFGPPPTQNKRRKKRKRHTQNPYSLI